MKENEPDNLTARSFSEMTAYYLNTNSFFTPL